MAFPSYIHATGFSHTCPIGAARGRETCCGRGGKSRHAQAGTSLEGRGKIHTGSGFPLRARLTGADLHIPAGLCVPTPPSRLTVCVLHFSWPCRNLVLMPCAHAFTQAIKIPEPVNLF